MRAKRRRIDVEEIMDYRKWLKNPSREELMAHESDQRKGVPPPPLQKPIPEGAKLVALPAVDFAAAAPMPLGVAIGARESRREYSDDLLTLAELAFLLRATQGVTEISKNGVWAKRAIPSGGCRHPLETYLAVRRVESLDPGLYRYDAFGHALIDLGRPLETAEGTLGDICFGQGFVDEAAVTFAWTAIPYRTEWRYGPDSLKDILMTSGHACQNLYLGCEAIGAGTCAILAYEQDAMDRYLGVDGEEETAIYCAPVGKVAVGKVAIR